MTTSEFERMISTATTQELICITATIYKVLAEKAPVRPARLSKGELKRAIKRFRIAQREYPEDAKRLEEAIAIIRDTWLHKAA